MLGTAPTLPPALTSRGGGQSWGQGLNESYVLCCGGPGVSKAWM